MPDFPLTDENRMIQQLVRRFVKEELMPLERELLGGPLGARGAFGEDGALAPEKYRELIEKLRAIGLWGIDLPEEYGGNPISEMSKALLYEELAKTIVPLGIPPDAPNFHMLRELTEGNEYQENEYFWPYVRGEKTSCFILTEPNAGSDAQQIETSAVRDGDNWVINGTKVFISNADRADFGILMAVTDREKRARGGFTSFLVDLQDRTPGVKLARPIYTIAGGYVWEVVFDNVVLPDRQRLGPVGGGFAPMQRRLGVRRLQIGSR
ncbi:MAG TPA: acyl-CoA dehydrogenase family protein, partial [Dehalococcoidia bacterium]|nr:acyl-CoA dehydrogenase family protein [Dehalococcoidia bacterium]